ncbi:peptidase inhibitor family I36 protein [Streptomyces olivoreticuli]
MHLARALRSRAATVLAATVLAAGAAAFAAPAALADGSPSLTKAPADGYDRCPRGSFCLFSGWDGGGEICWWYDSDPVAGRSCGFLSQGKNVKSAWNRTTVRVVYYTSEYYQDRIGSESRGSQTNLAGSYVVRSVEFP